MKKICLDELKNLYFEKKYSAKKTGELLNISEGTVNKKIKLLGLEKRTVSEANRKFTNFRIFENIDTEEKAYWLGYLFADGCMYNKEHIVKNKKYFQAHVTLTSIDKEIIDKFKIFMGNYTPSLPKTLKNGLSNKKCIYYVANFSSLELYKDLENKGMSEKKTYSLNIPRNVPDQLLKHFIRGFFDGDGSVYISNIKNPHKNPYKKQKFYKVLCCQIIANKIFCEFLRKNLYFLNQSKGINKEKRTKHNDVFYLKMSGKSSIKFYQYIYTGATVYLKRKKDKFDSFFKEKGSTTIISES